MANQLTKRQDERLENVGERRPVVPPRVDIFENKDELLLIADMPGVTDKELNIQLDEEELTVSGRPAEAAFPRALAREFQLGEYRRSFLVPQGIDRDQVSAELKNGVLWLHLPKRAAVKPRRIEVKAG